MAQTNIRPQKSSARKAKFIITTAMVVIILCIVCWFVYITGILPKVLTGISITETAADGTSTQSVENISVLEANFKFKEVFSSFSNYYGVTEDNLDETASTDATTGEGTTYRDMIFQEAANELMNCIMVNRSAVANGFMDYSQAARYAELSSDQISSMATLYGYQTADQFLSAQYGTGMTLRDYKKFMTREVLTNEYEQYIRQFTYMPAADAILAEYDANSSEYIQADFNYYFVTAATDDSGNVTGLDDAKAQAQAIADASTDSASFRQAVMDYLTQSGDDTALDSFADDADPTLCENYTSSYTDSMAAGLTDFIFGDDTKVGDTIVIPSDNGAYVAILNDRGTDDSTTVAYRILTLDNNTTLDLTTADQASIQADAEAQVAALMPAPVDSLGFYNLVKANSTDTDAIIDGGYNSGITIDKFTSTDDNQLTSDVVAAGEWLFDASRAQGDYMVSLSEDNSTISVYYFEGSMPAWQNTARNNLINASVNTWSDSIKSTNPQYTINKGLIERLAY